MDYNAPLHPNADGLHPMSSKRRALFRAWCQDERLFKRVMGRVSSEHRVTQHQAAHMPFTELVILYGQLS